ncbi:bacterial Ig-like domain-containing protein [Lactiplantibacillus plantarum]|uniref:bacterial Ig-like domain-containing protein n=1 Tax=Lactiplantibacillus plantarum TaxID=1590 RepID=UPI0021659747|nr:bacterial Ig-like domain-containing protein [Lactiplantibacillus plantarum]UVW06116.1 bacterial Ig-like domain-containing protein [Lactiplantibacillus plantarum]UWF36283.1 bacterial Ig-like domain-containing protein [Lactiplantibacillus plantarum]
MSATDEAGSALKLSDITVSGTVDPTKAGRYEVTYSYTDAAGNAVTKTATITVVASQASIDTKDSTLVAGPSTTWKAADNFVSATDEAGSALKLSDITVSGTVDPTKAGRYEVTYSYTDAAGNAVTKTATITVVASQASIDTKDSTLVAGPSTTWKAADNFVSATDEAGSALKLSDITVSGTVDPTKAGRYEVTYSYTDAAGNTVTKTATITVVASQASIDTKDSTLVAGPSTTWKAADNFVSATDEAGGALKLSDITVSGTVDPTKAGRYEVTYSYTDAAGNAVTKTATITVVASQASIDTKDSTLVAGPSTTWKAADNFVSATDEAGSVLKLSDITVSGTVDPTKAGRYEVTYSYTDAAGNAVTKTATITVVASQASIDTKDSTLVAGPSTTWKAADNFVSATDEAGSVLKLSDITVSGTVDPTKAGRYEVTYSYTDAAGNAVTKTATITVVASQASIDTKDSTLVAGPSTTWKAADNFVSATDEAGSVLKLSDITVSGTVDPTKAGRYEVTYSYTDAAGNAVTKTATITVVASQASIDTKDSTLVAGPSTTWKAADNFVSATDEAGSVLKLSDITVSGTVDPTKAGRYEVTYSYTDAAGNVVTKTATITVIVKSNPVTPGKPSQPAKPVSPVTPDQTNQSAKSDQRAKSDHLTTFSQVTSVKSGSALQTTTSHNELPQTDESTQRTMTLGGLLLLVTTSLLTFLGGKKRRNQD